MTTNPGKHVQWPQTSLAKTSVAGILLELQTPGYNGTADLVVLTLAAQNRVLTSQGPRYALAAGDGDDDNNKFTLTGVELSAKPGTAADSYKVRIDASDADFGAANAAMVDVTVVTRAAAADAALSGLALSAGAVLSPAFALRHH